MAAQGQTGLAQLPQENIDDILRDVQGSCGFKGLANCRLVSKDWLAAVQPYPVESRGTTDIQKLRKLSQVFPNMASMAVRCKSGALDLASFRHCSQLTSISFSAGKGSEDGTAELTVIGLPSSLKEAKFQNFLLPPNSLANTTTSLTQLHYQLDVDTLARQQGIFQPGDITTLRHWEWMRDLQHLQVN